MHIYLVRHGETEFNRLGIVQGSGVDTSLNETGRWQADAFYNFYKHLPFELFVTSALKRTHETLAPFLEQDRPWIQQPDINEISWGAHEGQPSTPERIALYRKTVGAWNGGDFDAALPEGESANQLAARVSRFLDWLRTREEEHILVCSHGRTLRCMVTLMKQQPLQHMEFVRHANTGCFKVQRREAFFHFEFENDTRHLHHAQKEL